MITAIIIDDEPSNIENLEQLLLRYCPGVNLLATALSAEEGKQIIAEQNPDLVFLDIHMPGHTGFQMLQSLQQYTFEVIFVTAHDNYGIQAVKFSALDYLLKPINTAELQQAVNKAILKSNQKNQNLQIENLIRLLQHNQQKDEHRIALPTAKETRFVNTQQIVRCESSNNYTSFYFANGDKMLVSKPIFEYEELLDDYGFIRCHQSHLVNKKHIRSLVKEDGGYLLLDDGTQLPLSKQKRDELAKMFRGAK